MNLIKLLNLLLCYYIFISANIFGSDIDIRVLSGIGIGYTNKSNKSNNVGNKNLNVFSNFINYQLPKPNIFRADINQTSIRTNEMFDSIICDPPYGYRAIQREVGEIDKDKIGREERVKKNKHINQITQTNKTEILNTEINNKISKELKQEKNDKINLEDDDYEYYQPLKQSNKQQIFENLFKLANECLRSNGLLVFLYPVTNEDM